MKCVHSVFINTKNLLLCFGILLSIISFSQKRLELFGVFAPDKQLVELNTNVWKKSEFGHFITAQVGNFGNRNYNNMNKSVFGTVFSQGGYSFYHTIYKGFLAGGGLGYYESFTRKLFYDMQVGLLFGGEKESITYKFIPSNWTSSATPNPIVYKTAYRFRENLITKLVLVFLLPKNMVSNLVCISLTIFL